MQKKLVRDPNNKMIAGVCSGIAEYFGWDPTWVRAAFGVSLLFGGTGFFIYIVLWIVMPEGPIYPAPPQWTDPGTQANAGYANNASAPGYEGNPYRAGEYQQTEYPGDAYQANNYPPNPYPQTTYTETTFTETEKD